MVAFRSLQPLTAALWKDNFKRQIETEKPFEFCRLPFELILRSLRERQPHSSLTKPAYWPSSQDSQRPAKAVTGSVID